jgi:hypothetical protein
MKFSIPAPKNHTMNTCVWGGGGIAPRILKHSTSLRFVISFTLRPPYCRGKFSDVHWTDGYLGPRTNLKSKNYFLAENGSAVAQ